MSAARYPHPYASLESATRVFGPLTALDEVSLQVHPGEVVALLGPNGAGKTTAVNLLLGLIPPTSGRARLFGGGPRARANITRVGMMLQSSGVPETLRVAELVDQFAAYYPAPLPVPEAIRLAGLTGLERRPFGRLSGGQRQRLLFALALSGDPELLFLDEPTVGLDVESRHGFWDVVGGMARRGRSVLLTTHYLEEAEALANRVVVLDRGRVIAEGATAEIRRLAATARIKARTSLGAREVASWPGVHLAEGGGEAPLEVVTDEPERVTLRLLQTDPGLSGLEVRSGTLEEAFLVLTGARERVRA